MSPPQADKAGLHILLKLAALVIILAGIHAAADILVQLLLALFFAIVLNPLVTWFIRRGVRRPFAITLVVTAMLVSLSCLFALSAFGARNGDRSVSIFAEPTHPYTQGLLDAIPRVDQDDEDLTVQPRSGAITRSVQ